MAYLGIEGSYVARRVEAGALSGVIGELRGGSLDGANVTMPLKTEAAALADVLTEEATASGSVNTIRMRSRAVEGHSTDVVASVRAFTDERFNPSAPILVLGAGGAAAAAIIAAAGRELVCRGTRYPAGLLPSGEDRRWGRGGSFRRWSQRRVAGECHAPR